MALIKVSSGTVEEKELLVAKEVNQNGLYLLMKRLIDVCGSLFGLILLSLFSL